MMNCKDKITFNEGSVALLILHVFIGSHSWVDLSGPPLGIASLLWGVQKAGEQGSKLG